MRITELPLISEIKDEYLQLRQNGHGRTAAVEELKLRYHDELTVGGEDDGVLFWVGIADAQLALKELSDEVAQMAMTAIRALEKSDWQVAPGDLHRRVQRYSCAPMPERENVRKPKKFRCEWRIGDAFAHQLSGQNADALDLSGKYIILRKVGALEWGDGTLTPIVTLSLWDALPLPQSNEAFSRTSPLRMSYGRMGTPENMYEYRTEILFSNKRQIDELKLEFLGNFPDFVMPKDETVFHRPGEVMMLSPKRFDADCCNFWKMHTYLCERERG